MSSHSIDYNSAIVYLHFKLSKSWCKDEGFSLYQIHLKALFFYLVFLLMFKLIKYYYFFHANTFLHLWYPDSSQIYNYLIVTVKNNNADSIDSFWPFIPVTTGNWHLYHDWTQLFSSILFDFQVIIIGN